MRHQQGTTMAGFIIGLIVGLAIAVIVALFIKGGSPFSDKASKLAELGIPTAEQAADPNRPLYSGKEAARRANQELAKRQSAQDDPLAPLIADIQASSAADNAASASGDAPASEALSTPVAPGTIIYYLQAGAFRAIIDAENTRAKLALLGFDATLSERTTDAGVLHRVRIGPFNQVEDMNQARAKLLDNGIDVAIVRNQK
jgi:cell division protein FtsN